MTFDYKFPFGATTLEIKTIKEIGSKILDGIELLISEFYFELNHNNSGSSAGKFNSSQKEIPVFVTKEFISFLELNLDYVRRFGDIYKPFGLKQSEINDSLTISESEGYVIKHGNFNFETSILRSAYIIDLLTEFLLENKFDIFFIGTSEFAVARGRIGWNVKLQEIKFPLTEQCALLVPQRSKKIDKHKFGALDNQLDYFEVVISGEGCTFLKLVSLLITEVNLKTEAHKFSKEWGVHLLFIDEEGEIIHSI